MELDPETSRHLDAAWVRRAGWDRREAVELGRTVYESMPLVDRPPWAGRLLEICLAGLLEFPSEIGRVAEIADDPERWSEAHDAFGAVRQLTLRAERGSGVSAPEMLLYVAENVAKITYNASGAPAPFDHKAGWVLLLNLRVYLDALAVNEVVEERLRRALWSVV